MSPSISVIVPAYQAEKTVEGAIESALNQTLAPLEIIVCDDGSTDGTSARLQHFGQMIHLVRQENAGVSAARNRAAGFATGDYLAWLDADDSWEPDYVEKVTSVLTARPDLDLLSVNRIELTARGVVENARHPSRPEFIDNPRAAILAGNGLYFPVVRTSLFREMGGFDECLRRMEDWDLWLRMILDGAQIGFVEEPLYRYNRLDSFLTTDGVAILASSIMTLNKVSYRRDLDIDEQMVFDKHMEWLASQLAHQVRTRRTLAQTRHGVGRFRVDALRNAVAARTPLRMRGRFLAAAVLPHAISSRRITATLEREQR